MQCLHCCYTDHKETISRCHNVKQNGRFTLGHRLRTQTAVTMASVFTYGGSVEHVFVHIKKFIWKTHVCLIVCLFKVWGGLGFFFVQLQSCYMVSPPTGEPNQFHYILNLLAWENLVRHKPLGDSFEVCMRKQERVTREMVFTPCLFYFKKVRAWPSTNKHYLQVLYSRKRKHWSTKEQK